MKNKNIIYNNHIQKKYFNSKLDIKYNAIIKKISGNLNSQLNNFHLFSKNFKFNFKTNDLYKFKKYQTVVIIGMGGSILGAEAIYHFLKKKIQKNFIFFDDIDENKLINLKSKHNLNKILFIVISKSGSTIETLSNFFSLQNIKKNSKNIIIITEKSNNPLYQISKKNGFSFIEHKNYIGGRYSVLSEAGMVPAYLMGLKIKDFRKILFRNLQIKNAAYLRESTIMLSSILKQKKLNNIILFNYVPELDKFMHWKQQLLSESLGKKGKGFLPTVSKAPKDHHSLLQLYLDGPKDKIFYIFSAETNKKNSIKIKSLDKKINYFHNKNLSQIKDAQKNAFIKVLKEKKISFREFRIKDFNEYTLGELFSYFMLETAIIGQLSDINPFNQPAVEQVKFQTKNLLSKKILQK